MLLYFVLGLLVGVLLSITYYIIFACSDIKLFNKHRKEEDK